MKTRVYVAVIDIPTVIELATFDYKFEDLTKYPAVLREGNQIKEGFKSMAYSIVFRSKDRTLEDADVTAAMKKILNGLEGLGIELRS